MPSSANLPATTSTATVSAKTGAVPWWGSIDSLWLLTAPLCTLLYSLLLPIAPNDLWYHMRAGWYIAAHGTIPAQNLFSWGVPAAKPYLYQSWIAEWLLYVTLRQGLAWIVVLRGACLTLAVALVVWATYRRALRQACAPGIAAKAAACGGLLGLVITSNNLDIRPQTFSVPLFAVWLFALGEWPSLPARSRLAWGGALVFLMGVWVNLHGAFPMGLIAIAASAAGTVLGPWLPAFKSSTPRARTDFSLAAVLGLATLAVGFNPRGFAIFRYLLLLGNLPANHQFIEEWQPPHLNEWHSALFLLSPLLILALGLRAWKRGGASSQANPGGFLGGLGAGDWLLGLGLWGLGANSVRAILWYALWLPFAAGVLAAAALSRAPASLPAQPPVPRPVQLVNAALLALLCLTPIPLLPWFKVDLPWPPAFAGRFASTPQKGPNGFPGAPGMLLDSNTPVRAAEYLRTSPPRGRLFCDMVMGSYVMWALYPEVKPYADPRVELYPYDFWIDYRNLSLGKAGSDQELIAKGCTDALLDATSQAGLVTLLRHSASWQLIYSPGQARLFRLRPANGTAHPAGIP